MSKDKIRILFLLHIMLMFYSMIGVFSKKASAEKFLSLRFLVYYFIIVLFLAIYAIVWQQIIKRISLITAFANKSVTVVWGIIWGILFFHESLTIGKVAGSLLVIAGVIMYAVADSEKG